MYSFHKSFAKLFYNESKKCLLTKSGPFCWNTFNLINFISGDLALGKDVLRRLNIVINDILRNIYEQVASMNSIRGFVFWWQPSSKRVSNADKGLHDYYKQLWSLSHSCFCEIWLPLWFAEGDLKPTPRSGARQILQHKYHSGAKPEQKRLIEIACIHCNWGFFSDQTKRVVIGLLKPGEEADHLVNSVGSTISS